jgi:hypothetical protein
VPLRSALFLIMLLFKSIHFLVSLLAILYSIDYFIGMNRSNQFTWLPKIIIEWQTSSKDELLELEQSNSNYVTMERQSVDLGGVFYFGVFILGIIFLAHTFPSLLPKVKSPFYHIMISEEQYDNLRKK